MYQSKKLLLGLGMNYEKINVSENNCMLLWEEITNKKKCKICGTSRFVEVVNKDDVAMIMVVSHKQFVYMTLVPRLRYLFVSQNTARHMRWHKEGIYDNLDVMSHLADTGPWKALDAIDPSFASDVRNVCIILAIDGFHLSMYLRNHIRDGPCFLFHTTFHRLFPKNIILYSCVSSYLV